MQTNYTVTLDTRIIRTNMNRNRVPWQKTGRLVKRVNKLKRSEIPQKFIFSTHKNSYTLFAKT